MGNWTMATAPSALHTACLAVAAAQGLDPSLLEAVALVESGGRPDALRYEPGYYLKYIHGNPAAAAARFGPLAACSFGPMQILLESACEQGFVGRPEDLFDLVKGLAEGAKYLKSLLDALGGNADAACIAYNGGLRTAEKGPPWPNQGYLDRVHRALKGLP